jgi:hypothetical protein
MRPLAAVAALVIAGSLRAVTVQAMPAPVGAAAEQGLLCRTAIHQAEAGSQMPPHMLAAIGRVESGRADPADGRVSPWPWTINAAGEGKFFDSKAEAVAFTRDLLSRGVQSIDVGCMQINLMHHPDAFHSLEEAFDPGANARYAVTFLNQLRDKTGSWETASAWYHSADPQEGDPYREKVAAAMETEAKGSSSFAALSTSGAVAWPVAASSASGILAGRGNVILLPRANGGAELGRPGAVITTSGGSLSSTAVSGRGLDAYRLQPVRLAKFNPVTTR